MNAQGLRVVLVAAALIALLHGLMLKALEDPRASLTARYHDRPGRAHDGRPHESLGRMFIRSREDDLREMFEFASQSSKPNDAPFAQYMPETTTECSGPLELDDGYMMDPDRCASGPEVAGYMGAAIVNRFKNENVINGGIQDGIAAYDDTIGFGGSVL